MLVSTLSHSTSEPCIDVETDHGSAIASIRHLDIQPLTNVPSANVHTEKGPVVRNIHIHIPSSENESKSDNIHIHIDTQGIENGTTSERVEAESKNTIISHAANEGQSSCKSKAINGNYTNGRPKFTSSPPSWSNGLPKVNGTTVASG